MAVHLVLFEDHTWQRFRPAAASMPLWELRCGMFNARERLGLSGTDGGTLLGRLILDALGTATGWVDHGKPSAGASTLWVSGRMTPSPAALDILASMAERTDSWAWFDDAGLVAAAVSAADWPATVAGWERWRDGDDAIWRGPAWPGSVDFSVPCPGQRLAVPASTAPELGRDLAAAVARVVTEHGPALRWIWDVVDRTASALAGDLGAVAEGRTFVRSPFGIIAAEGGAGPWARPTALASRAGDLERGGVHAPGEHGVFLGEGVELSPGVVLDHREGPVVLDAGCRIGPHTTIQGPVYIGPYSRVKAGATLYGPSSFGIGNRIAGEIGESTFGDFANKQHDGFIGHAVCGAWTNLGAMTTCSDLKNNYGSVRVDLGDGPVDTGRRFMGLLLGDHVKTAIGTLFNTGTCVGFATNIFGTGMPPKLVPPFRWGGVQGGAVYDVERALETARIVMERRGCRLVAAHEELFRSLALSST